METTVLAVLAFVAGAVMVVATLLSAIMTLVVPRALPVMITRWVFRGMRALFRLRGGRARSFEARDRDLAREFDQVCRELAEAGVPRRADLDQAWRDFAGWRVNYDRVLLSLAALTMAPYAP